MSVSKQLYANNASSTLGSDITAVSTSISVATGHGTRFPTPSTGEYFLITLEVGTTREIVKISSRSGDVLTVAASGRGQEGTTAATWSTGALIEMRVTKDTLGRLARLEDRMAPANTVDDLPSALLTDANSFLLGENDDGQTPIVAIKDTDSRWGFLNHKTRRITGTVTSSTTTSITTTAIGSLIDNVVAGKYIVIITSGTQAGFARTVTSSTTNVVNWSAALTPAVGAGESFEVLQSDYSVMANPGRVGTSQAGGTVDAMTAAFVPVYTSYTENMMLEIEVPGANTVSNPTLAVDGMAAKTITDNNGDILQPGNYRGKHIFVYDSGSGVFRLINPYREPVYSGTAKNKIINGNFNIWQRGTSFAAPISGIYSADRWVYGVIGAAVHTVSRSTDVPTVAQAGILFNYSILLDCTTADASIAAADTTEMSQRIEGYTWATIAQRPMTLSFWVKATKTGIYCVGFRNTADRSYVAEYTINTTNTWEKKTIVVPASPSAGTWNYTTGLGMTISFVLASGSNNQTTAGTWQTGLFTCTSNQVNGTDSTSNDFRLAGVQLESGNVATSFEETDLGLDILKCQRYYQQIVIDYNSHVAAAGTYATSTMLIINMRTTPTVSGIDSGSSGAFSTTVGALSASLFNVAETRTADSTAVGRFITLVTANAEL